MTVTWNLVTAAVSSCQSDVNIEISVIKMSAKFAKSSKVKDRSIFWCERLHGVAYQACAGTLYITIYVIDLVSVLYWRHPILHFTYSVKRIVSRVIWMASSLYHDLFHKRRRSHQRPIEQAKCVISRIDLNSEGPGENNSISASFLWFESDTILQPISQQKQIQSYTQCGPNILGMIFF
jgi:hypothetical protein